jgi:hypothetical protein
MLPGRMLMETPLGEYSLFVNAILIEVTQMPTVRKLFLMPVQSQLRE